MVTKGDLLRLWALLDELEDLIRLSPFHELMVAILHTRKQVVEMMGRLSDVQGE